MTVAGGSDVSRDVHALSVNDCLAFTNRMRSYCVVFWVHTRSSTQVQHQVTRHSFIYFDDFS